MDPDERFQNYIKRMTHFKLGHPITDPDNFTRGDPENQVRVGDVGFFQRNHTWIRIFNVFEPRDAPKDIVPWDRTLPQFETYYPNNSLGGFLSKDFSVSGGSASLSLPSPAPGVSLEIEQHHNRAAALIIPPRALRESFDETRLSAITRSFIEHYEKWYRHAREEQARVDLKIWNLVLVFSSVKSAHWALASSVEKKTSLKLRFDVSAGPVQASAGVWGRWHHVVGPLVICGPHDSSLASVMGEEAATDLENEGDNKASSREMTGGSEDTLNNRPQDRCVFMTRLKVWRVFYNPFSQRHTRVKFGAGPTNHIDNLLILLRETRVSDELRWDDTPPTGEVMEWTCTLTLTDGRRGIGYAVSKGRARETAAGDILGQLRDIETPAAVEQTEQRPSAERHEGDPPDLYDEYEDDAYPPKLSDLTDALDILMWYLYDRCKKTGDPTVKYVAATDDHVSAFLKDSDLDEPFHAIILSAKPSIVVENGVAGVQVPGAEKNTLLPVLSVPLNSSKDQSIILSSKDEDHASTKMQHEDDEDPAVIPDEFLDPLMFSLMRDPVILPSSMVTIDRATIELHLLSDPSDPFNRVPLKIEDVIPDPELKARIHTFILERRVENSARLNDELQNSESPEVLEDVPASDNTEVDKPTEQQ